MMLISSKLLSKPNKLKDTKKVCKALVCFNLKKIASLKNKLLGNKISI